MKERIQLNMHFPSLHFFFFLALSLLIFSLIIKKKRRKPSIDLTYEQNEETSWAQTLIPPVCFKKIYIYILISGFQVYIYNKQETKNNN